MTDWRQTLADTATPQDMAVVADMRKRLDHACAVCGDGFTAIKTARYCSNRCRQIAKRERAARANR